MFLYLSTVTKADPANWTMTTAWNARSAAPLQPCPGIRLANELRRGALVARLRQLRQTRGQHGHQELQARGQHGVCQPQRRAARPGRDQALVARDAGEQAQARLRGSATKVRRGSYYRYISV